MAETFFRASDGSVAHLYHLRNAKGFGADITDWGGTVVSLFAPDRTGKLVDVALGFKDPALYEENEPSFGILVGRIANRIKGGTFVLDGKRYQLNCNDHGFNTLHGDLSYGRRMWQAEQTAPNVLKLSLTSPDGDAGFPGEVQVEAVYTVGDDNSLTIEYHATTDRTTVVNLTNHTYFNLNGESSCSSKGEVFTLQADRRTEVDEHLAPTGRSLPVEGTIYDLRQGRTFEEIAANTPSGFDDNFIIADARGDLRTNVAKAVSKNTGITMTVDTTEPGIQLYMGFFLDNTIVGKSGNTYPQYSAFCYETQLWPDAVNHDNFPSARLEPGETYFHKTVYRFSVEA